MRKVLMVMASLLATASAAPERDARAADRVAIVAGETAWGQSFVTGDLATVDRLVDDAFLATAPDGSRYTKAEMVADLRRGPAVSENVTNVETIHFWGDTAVVQGRDDTVGLPPARKLGVRIWTDTWVKLSGRWRIVSSHDMRPPAQ